MLIGLKSFSNSKGLFFTFRIFLCMYKVLMHLCILQKKKKKEKGSQNCLKKE